MGEVNLGRAFDTVPRVLRDQVVEDTFTSSGQLRELTGLNQRTRRSRPRDPCLDRRSRIDRGSRLLQRPRSGGDGGRHDLQGKRLLGRLFRGGRPGGCQEQPGERVSSAGTSGSVKVTVEAANVSSDGVPSWGGPLDQDFALVVYNAESAPLPVLVPGPP